MSGFDSRKKTNRSRVKKRKKSGAGRRINTPLILLIAALCVCLGLVIFTFARDHRQEEVSLSKALPAVFCGDEGRAWAKNLAADERSSFTQIISDEKEAAAIRKISKSKKKTKQAGRLKKTVKKTETASKADIAASKKASVSEIRKKRYEIMGTSTVTRNQIVRHYRQYASYPSNALKKGGAATLEKFVQIICEEAETEGVRAEIVYAQAMLETGWLKFQGGDDDISQYNFAGLGTVGDGNHGNSFKDVRTGIRAQVQHLKAYACNEPLTQKCVDKRFNRVKRGSAPYVQWLGIQENPTGAGWAGAKNYGSKIMKLIRQIRSM